MKIDKAERYRLGGQYLYYEMGIMEKVIIEQIIFQIFLKLRAGNIRKSVELTKAGVPRSFLLRIILPKRAEG